MRSILVWAARLAAVAGIAVMALAAVVRLSGDYWVGGFQVGTLLQVGIALTLVGCLGYLAALVERAGP